MFRAMGFITGKPIKKEAIHIITDYIEYYNQTRLHSYNDYRSPFVAEAQWWHHQMLQAA